MADGKIDVIQRIRDAANEVSHFWSGMTAAWESGEPGVAIVGNDEYGHRYELMTIDTAQYYHPEGAIVLARYYAEVNPDAVLSVLSVLDEAMRACAEVHSLRAEVAMLKDKLNAAQSNERHAMSWLADCRIAAGCDPHMRLPDFIERLKVMASALPEKGIQAKSTMDDFEPVFMARENPCCRQCYPAAPIMILCPECGNKRCPKAANHNNTCTGSNETGQSGSDYP